MKIIVETHRFIDILIPFTFVNIIQTITLILFLDNLDMITTAVLSTADLPIVNTTVMMVQFCYRRESVLQKL